MADEEYNAYDAVETLIYNQMGVRGIGEWLLNKWNSGASLKEIQMALRFGTDKSPEGQAAYGQYLQAYPGMDKLLSEKLIPGSDPEAVYNGYVNTIKEAAQRYGVDESLVTRDKAGSYMLNKNAPDEIVNRMALAANAVATTPPETIAVLRDYYGLQSNDLVTFYLDTTNQEDVLKSRYAAAQIGTAAAREKFGINKQEAEQFVQRGFDQADATARFAQAASQESFQQGAGETANRQDIYSAALGDQEAIEKVNRIAQSRTGRFAEGGAFAAGERGISGLGTSATR